MPILLTSDRDGIAVTGPEALSLLAAGCAVVDLDDGDAADPHHHNYKELPMPRKYPWPLGKLDHDIAVELFAEAKHSGRSVSAIVAEAVADHFNAKLARGDGDAVRSADRGPAKAA